MAEQVPPPQNLEAEEMLLASLMSAPANAAEVAQQVSADDFYKEGHRRVYEAVMDLYMTGEPVEPLTVIEQLTKSGELDGAGGRMGVLAVMESPYIAASSKTYADIVRDTATQRRLLRVGQQIESTVATREGETSHMLQLAEDLIYDLSQTRVRGDFRGARELVIESMERLTEASERGSEITGLATGFLDLDRLTGGLRPGNLVVMAARPSMGKTSLALGVAENVSLKDKGTVAIFSLEMSADEIIHRMLGSVGEVSATRVRSGQLSADDWTRLTHATDRLSQAKLYIDDSEGMTVAEMRTKARRLKSRDSLDLIVVDYIQLMEGPRTRRDENRVQEISAISRALKMLGRDLGVPVICVSQLNRAPDARPDKRPLLSDLRESGAIEQDADMVMMLYRDDYYDPDSTDKGIAEVNLVKNRNGPTDRVKLTFRGTYAKFGNLARNAS